MYSIVYWVRNVVAVMNFLKHYYLLLLYTSGVHVPSGIIGAGSRAALGLSCLRVQRIAATAVAHLGSRGLR